jgi:hypothetical protein
MRNMKNDSKRNTTAKTSKPKSMKQVMDEAISKWLDEGAPMPKGEEFLSVDQKLDTPQKPDTERTLMPRYFRSPDGADMQEDVAYPEKFLTIDDLMDDESQRCMAYVQHRTGVSLKKFVSRVLKEWYDIEGCDVSAAYLEKTV